MSNYRLVLTVAVSIIIGILIGITGASLFWSNFNGESNTSNLSLKTQADIVTKVAVLEHLRGNMYSEGERMLETLLDGDLMTAGALARSGIKFNPNVQNAIELERSARVLSGYEPAEKTIRRAVQETFHLFHGNPEGIDAQTAIPFDDKTGRN